MRPSRDIQGLLDIMAALRTPETGCPWDLEQDFATIAPYTIEEAYEVADAIARGDMDDLKDELGDLLLQVVFHARMAEEAGAFAFADVCETITAKMIRRHPHVFADGGAGDPAAVRRSWDEIKAGERAGKRRGDGRPGDDAGQRPASLLDDVPLALPALMRAVKLQKRAARVGFDWNDPALVLDKIREETDELSRAIAAGGSREIADEIGDMMFALANLARHLDVDPEAALRGSNEKFRRRFSHVERRAAEGGHELAAVGLDRMEEWWTEAKDAEGGGSGRSSRQP